MNVLQYSFDRKGPTVNSRSDCDPTNVKTRDEQPPRTSQWIHNMSLMPLCRYISKPKPRVFRRQRAKAWSGSLRLCFEYQFWLRLAPPCGHTLIILSTTTFTTTTLKNFFLPHQQPSQQSTLFSLT